ncbi:MAG: hypothetical protein V3V23_00940 [Dehalococcoidales bacterium]
MIRLLRQIIKSEKGQALPIVLSFLVIGGLTIAPSLNYTATSLNGSRIIGESISGMYAAEAGVEDTLWSLQNGESPSTQLPENINQMEVNMQTEDKGTYTLYLGELIQPGEHSDYLDIDGEMLWDEGAQAYKYTVTVIWQPESGQPVIHLKEVGAKLPLDYSYQTGSAASFAGNLSTDEPIETTDTSGAYLLNWTLESPLPSVSESNPVQTQTFYITGEGSQEGHYAWVVASREDIGAIGEIIGRSYEITATATRPGDGQTTGKIVAEVMIGGGTTNIVSWQILN